jgi:hypothetical protein
MAETSRCEAITKSGSRCSARAQQGSDWCSNHDPDPARAEERRQNAAAGGRLRSRRRPSEAERVRKKLWKIADDVLTGKIHRDRAIASTQALNAILRSLTVERDLTLSEELFEEIDRLEGEVESIARRSIP